EASENQPASSSMRLRSVPICEIVTSTTSPALIHNGGVRVMPTPDGVPVAITSPGSRGVNPLQYSMIRGTSWIRSDVSADCTTSPLSLVSRCSSCEPGIEYCVEIHGPKLPQR